MWFKLYWFQKEVLDFYFWWIQTFKKIKDFGIVELAPWSWKTIIWLEYLTNLKKYDNNIKLIYFTKNDILINQIKEEYKDFYDIIWEIKFLTYSDFNKIEKKLSNMNYFNDLKEYEN